MPRHMLARSVWPWPAAGGSAGTAALARSLQGASVLGVEAILAKDPQQRPVSVACSPAPRVHAAIKAARKTFYDA